MKRLVSPLPASMRHASDERDDQEHADVARILSGLPERHLAREAYESGSEHGADTARLAMLVHPEAAAALAEAVARAEERARRKR